MPAELSKGLDRFRMSLSPDEDIDGDWLLVEIDVRMGTRAYSEADGCLTRAEALGLAEWMEAPLEGPRSLEFREGNLRFVWAAPTLSIFCDLELAPPDWDDLERGFEVRLEVTEAAARRFAAELREEVSRLGEERAPVLPLIPAPPRRR